MKSYRSERDIQGIKESCRIVAEVLNELEAFIKPGINTSEVCKRAESIILKNNGRPAFKGYSIPGLPPYPTAICASVNSCIVHGIPREDQYLQEGDIIGIDVGVEKNGYYGDAARTYPVGKIETKTESLLKITKIALQKGIEQAKAGNRVGNISEAIGSYVKQNGYFVADNLTGHGVGKELHEKPIIPNDGKRNSGMYLSEGMTLAIEPMVNCGTNKVIENGWEFFVADNSLSAHFEHTILLTEDKPLILTQ
jgi:methionyl aminopeptidase